jgi:hypothetical protein
MSSGNAVHWYEQTSMSPPTFVQQIVSQSTPNARSAFALDFNGDGA